MSNDRTKITPLKREPLIPAAVAKQFANSTAQAKPGTPVAAAPPPPKPAPAPVAEVKPTPAPAVPAAPAPAPVVPMAVEEKQRRSQQKILFTKMPELNRYARATDVDIEAELNEAMAGFDADSTFQKPDEPTPGIGGSGQKKIGKIISIHGDDVFIDVGGRSQGVLPAMGFAEPPVVGNTVEVIIKGYNNAHGLLNLALPGAAEASVDWSSVTRGMVVEVKVTATNTGGLTVEVNGIRGFLPISQIELFRIEDTKPYINQKLKCIVSEVNPAEKNLVVSRRALLDQEREAVREKIWSELAEGQRLKATVRNIKDFGVFVDLGGVDALLPMGEISWNKIDDASKVLSPGQSVEVIVTRLDREKRKVSVSLRQTLASPWDDAELKYGAGTTVEGTVTKTADYGAFVELEPGIEGLVHVSELSKQRVWRVGDVVKPGDKVTVKVLTYDSVAKRISLSVKAAMKDAEPTPKPEDAAEAEPEAPVKPILRRTDLKGGLGGKR